MSPTVYAGSVAIVEAVREFLEDGAHGGSNSPAETFNDTLALTRTAYSVAIGALPDIAEYQSWISKGPNTSLFPSLAIIWEGDDGEDDPYSGRLFGHRLALHIYLPVGKVDDATGALEQQAAAVRAIGLYALTLKTIFYRELGTNDPAAGKDLNNGGTGRAQGKISLSRLGASVPMIAGTESVPAIVLATDLLVRIREPYRA